MILDAQITYIMCLSIKCGVCHLLYLCFSLLLAVVGTLAP